MNYNSSGEIYKQLSDDSTFDDVEVSICPKKRCGSLINEEVNISSLIEVVKLRVRNINNNEINIEEEVSNILKEPVATYKVMHEEILERYSSDTSNVISSGQQDSGVRAKEVTKVGGILKRGPGLGNASPVKRVKFSIENLEKQKNNIDMKVSTSSCSSYSSSNRKKRNICQEEESNQLFPYEPLLGENVEDGVKISSRLYSQLAYLVSLKYPRLVNKNVESNNILTYNTYIGDIISEGELNHSVREQELLRTYYQTAQDFFSEYPKNTVLDSVETEVDLSNCGWLFDNGKHSLLVSYDGNRYQLYSHNLNYRQLFQTKEGINFVDIELFAEAFFKWSSGSIEYKLFTLSKNLPEGAITKMSQANFWEPNRVAPDLLLLNKGSFSHIEGIPAKMVRELFLLDGKVPDLKVLHKDFFSQYLAKISFKIEELHNILPSLTTQESNSLINLVKQYNFPVDTSYLSKIPENVRSLLESYHNELTNKLSLSRIITIQDLSNLSWKILEDKIGEHPDVSPGLKESSLKSIRELYSVASERAYELGITSQTLFFLPDIIRSANTGNFDNLKAMGLMLGGDATFNHLYTELVNKLGPILPEGRVELLRKLPITSPIFKVLTVYSIVELTDRLNTLPPNSEESSIIKHQLGEQYLTIGLMIAEIFGFELGPLWLGLMAEQLIYGALSLRKQYNLDIPFWEAFLMNLGFEQDKLQSILEERQLVDINLSQVNMINNQTQIPYGWVIVKVPKLTNSYSTPQADDTSIKFKPYYNICQEDNVFLAESSGYKKIASVDNKEYRDCVSIAPLRISGTGLAALYANRQAFSNDISQRNLYVNFDPREGQMKLDFTIQGLEELEKLNLNHNNEYKVNLTNPYIITIQIYNKPYPDSISLSQNRISNFILDDSSKRIVSRYYIDGTIPFQVRDNTDSTSIVFLNKKLFNGYDSYISGNASNIQVQSIYFQQVKDSGNIFFGEKKNLKLILNSTVINEKLEVEAEHVEILYARGIRKKLTNIIEIKPKVLTFNLLLGSSINVYSGSDNGVRINIKNINDLSLVSFKGLLSKYKSYYTFEVEDIQPILDTTIKTSNFPRLILFHCNQKPILTKEKCRWFNSSPEKNTLIIRGKLGDKSAFLEFKKNKEVLKVSKNQDGVKHIEVIHYDNSVIELNSDLKFKKVLELFQYHNNTYYYDNIIRSRKLSKWLILVFESDCGDDILHHFEINNSINKVNINKISYLIKENRIYAVLEDVIDGSKLLRYGSKKTVPISVNASLNDSIIFLEGESFNINNSTLTNLLAQTLIYFKGNSPISVQFLKDSFKVADTNHSRYRRTVEKGVGSDIEKSSIDASMQADGYVENDQKQIFSFYEVSPVSSSASRPKFWLTELVKEIGSAVMNIAKCLVPNYFNSITQFMPVLDDVTSLKEQDIMFGIAYSGKSGSDAHAEPYLLNIKWHS